MLDRIYQLSPHVRLSGTGDRFALLCAYPLQRFEVNESAFRVLGALDGATPLNALVSPVSPALIAFLESLVTQGCLTVRYRAVHGTAEELAGFPASPSVEVVIPVLDNASGLGRCLAALAGLDYPRERFSITVVDDGSAQPVERCVGPLPAGMPPLRWLRLPANVGPASARNAALFTAGRHTPSQLVAFTDSDCVPGVRWLAALTAVLEEPGLAAVGGQVLGASGRTWLARYEDACASLNLGRLGGAAGAPNDRLPYLPTCNLLVRREALMSVGGFTPGLRLGEDVDLVWRLRDHGWSAFYLPSESAAAQVAVPAAGRAPPEDAVLHEYRDRLAPFLSRKAAYARSETWLRMRHPSHFPGRAPGLGTVTVALTGAGCLAGGKMCVVGLAAAGAGLLAGMAWHGWTRRRAASPWLARATLAALARRAAATVLAECRSLVRQHAVLVLPLLAPSPWRPAWLLWLAAILAAAVCGEALARRPALPFPVFCAGYILDAMAYSAGRWLSRMAGWMKGPPPP